MRSSNGLRAACIAPAALTVLGMVGIAAPTAPAAASSGNGPGSSGPPPYLKLAQLLGTPKLVEAVEPRDKSRMLLEFVPNGESASRWTKMTTVSIAQVPKPQTQAATYGIIDRFRRDLMHHHARITTFDLAPIKPYSAYFAFTAEGQSARGIAYSPAAGFVTIAQLAEKRSGAISQSDVSVLKAVIGRR